MSDFFNFVLGVFTVWLIYSFVFKKNSGKSYTKKTKSKNKNLKPSEKWILENISNDDWIEKYNFKSIESRYVKQWAQFVFNNEKKGSYFICNFNYYYGYSLFLY